MVWYSFFLDADGAGPNAGGGGGGGGGGIVEVSDDIVEEFPPSSAHNDKRNQPRQNAFISGHSGSKTIDRSFWKVGLHPLIDFQRSWSNTFRCELA